MTVASLRRIGALIREQKHVLLARWRRNVRQLPSAQSLDTPTLNDHMPVLLDELADALESQPDDSAEEALLQGSPPVHGRQRLHDGFNVEEVIAEYNVLRGCIHDLAEENGIVIHGNDLRVVNRMIDEAVGLAVQTYSTQLSLEIKKTSRRAHRIRRQRSSHAAPGHLSHRRPDSAQSGGCLRQRRS